MPILRALIAAILLTALYASAQSPQNLYSATSGDVSLSSSGMNFTIQQPATNGKTVTLVSALVYCGVACNITQAINGAAATATAGTASALSSFAPAALATIWTASNVGTGTPAGGILHLAGGAGTERTLDMSSVVLRNNGTSSNYTFTVSVITGTVNITLIWSER